MTDPMRALNLVGAVVALSIQVLMTAVFIARLSGRPKIEHGLGIAVIMMIVPLSYLFVAGFRLNRPFLYFLQVGLMTAFLVVEGIVDYALKLDFRRSPRLVLPYIILFYAGCGGMIGVAGLAGKGWLVATAVSFLVMMVVSIVQRYITGQ